MLNKNTTVNKMSKVLIKPEIIYLLKETGNKPFSSRELCKQYENIDSYGQLSKRQIYQFIVRNIRRLLTNGFLKQLVGSPSQYTTTAKFHSGDYGIGKPHLISKKITTKRPGKDIQKHLSTQLSNLKHELMITLAEVEEYERLSQQHPDMRDPIQNLYNLARNRHSHLLGKIKATESLSSACIE